MKKSSLLCASVAVLIMSSCSAGMMDEELPAGRKAASVEIKVQGVACETRAIGTLPTENDDNKITNVTVGIFDEKGVADVVTESALNEEGLVTIKATAGSRKIIVVANAPSGTFAGALNIDMFRARTLMLTQDKNLLPMSGESAALIELKAGSSVKTTVDISRLVARIQLTGLKTKFDPRSQYSKATFTVDRVFLYNAKSSSSVALTPITGSLIHGFNGKVVGEKTLLDPIVSQPITDGSYTTPCYFYTFANDLADITTATKLVVGGKFSMDGSSTTSYVYYPAVINRPQSGTEITGNGSHSGIMRNNIYSIEATIKGIGVDSPDKFMEPSSLDLSVRVTPWGLNVLQKIDF